MQKKLGPLKTWQWAAVAGAAVILYYVYSVRKANAAANQQSQAPTAPQPDNQTAYTPIDPTTGLPYSSGGLTEWNLQEIIDLLSKLEKKRQPKRKQPPGHVGPHGPAHFSRGVGPHGHAHFTPVGPHGPAHLRRPVHGRGGGGG